MATNLTKAIYLGVGVSGIAGAGGILATTLNKSSTIAQTLKEKGYELISEITDNAIKTELFKAKWTSYKSASNKDNAFSSTDDHTKVAEKDFESLCTKHEKSNDITFKERVIKWCTLNIEDKITKISKKTYNPAEAENDSWTQKFTGNKSKVKALLNIGDDESNADSKLHGWCNEAKTKSISNENKSVFDDALALCVT